MKSWGISAASEQKQRAMMKADLENMSVEAEGVPFSFNIKRVDKNSDQPLWLTSVILNLLFFTCLQRIK